jgi:MoaA/NifB/PqqE/SkfB family radical SAM enzyme
MRPADIKWLQVENTSKCNAWCTACGRNNGGFGLREGLVEEDLTIERFTEVLDMLPNLEAIQFSPTYGDPAASSLAMKHFELAVSRVGQVNIHTNGSLRSTQWWENVAQVLASVKHEVWFAIDGLAGTHEIYRQGTSWQKVIDNATAFINAGGNATWQFIPFKHNEHEIVQCIKLSQDLGFKTFKFIRDVRYPRQGESRHYQTGQVIEILPWSRDKAMSKYNQTERYVTESQCRHLQQPSIYLSSNGQIANCCFFNKHRPFDSFDELPDIKVELASAPHQQCLLSCGTCATINTYDDN